ncbi:hypothetical protein FAES_3648 [Fibrella aestuarina BUZ 2]|uniref:Uncharacterized protein n=1 Tax=Fibrella aestuarina BUZ 2 TaxID=1166018 RepID=I0KC02_9BACT|nr:hypothetical protein [Fibrella aestuarina]CCH01655.1 hypothetical protein FAES_3648 [Fibrella aestuarina BUZ 2]
MADYQSIKFPAPRKRMGGTAQKILLADFDKITTLQEPAANSYNITTPHVFGNGEGFIELYVIQDTGELKFEKMGGKDRVSFKATGKFHHPGEADEIDNFANNCGNTRWVALVPLPGTTDLYQIGDKEFQMSIFPSYDTGKNSGDGRTSMFDFECFCANKIKYKASTIPMKGVTP